MKKSMTVIREEIRQDIAKQYKGKIHELVNENAKYRQKYLDMCAENEKLKRENERLKCKLSGTTPLDGLAKSMLQIVDRTYG